MSFIIWLLPLLNQQVSNDKEHQLEKKKYGNSDDKVENECICIVIVSLSLSLFHPLISLPLSILYSSIAFGIDFV